MILLDSEQFSSNEINWQNPDYTELTKHLYRVQKITDGEVTFRHHLASVLKNKEGIEIGRVIKSPNSFKGIKVKINEIGEISPL
jgi:CRISPR-associated endonuclease Csn1